MADAGSVTLPGAGAYWREQERGDPMSMDRRVVFEGGAFDSQGVDRL